MTEDESEFDFQRDNIAGAISDLDGGYLENGEPYQIASVFREIEFCGVPFEFSIDVFLRPGYYDGAYLDGKIYLDGSEYDDVHDIDFADILEQGLWDTDQACQYRSTGQVRGFAVMQSKNLEKRLLSLYSSIIENIEKVAAPLTDQIIEIGRFSNGSAVYKRVS
jgi:hypothetical protein